MDIKWIGASGSNYMQGREWDGHDHYVKKIVVHWIVGTLEAADATFQDGRRRASAHYGVGDSDVHQYVKEEDTAYHAGDFDVNLESIGIEHEGGPDLPISDKTYETSARLIRDICVRHNIPIHEDNIRPHNEFKATQCPGNLDIKRLVALANGFDHTGSEDEVDWEELALKWKAERDKKDRKYEKEKQEHAKTKRDKDKQIQQLLDANKIAKDAALSHTSDMNLLRAEKKVEKKDKEIAQKERDAAVKRAERAQRDLGIMTTKYKELKERREAKQEMADKNQKMWYLSKTLWVNILALAAIIIQGVTGKMWLSAELQGSLLTFINLFLRAVTKEEIVWK